MSSWDPQSGMNVQTLAGQGGTVCSLAWSPDGKLLASGYSDGSIWVWEPEVPEPDTRVQRLSGHTDLVTGLAFAPDGAQFASASFDGTVKLWDTESLGRLQTFSGHTDRVLRVVWSPDGRTLASCSFDHTIWLWDVKEGDLGRYCIGIPLSSTHLPSHPTAATCSVAATMAPCWCGTWKVDSVFA